MNSKWAETGILRKRQTKENFDDLLVFGYACKLFRDDERALYIDQGKHLIPWMGDERLKIDRYDGRGALSSLSSFEASREGYDATRWLGLNENERKLEQLCDEERYYSLLNNEEEENMYKEEESKRQKANEFQYNYNESGNNEENSEKLIPTCEEEDRPFIPAKELDVPVDIDIPKTVKENARIEKTAQFVSQQGPQMEILIKAKQKDNPQFSFMNHNDPLHKYYRHLLNAIKSGQYKPEKEGASENNEETTDIANTNVSETNDNEHYLHPLLSMTANMPTKQTVLPIIKPTSLHYKPTADCAYTQLVSRIKGNSIDKLQSQRQETTCSNDNQTQLPADVSDQYYPYYQAYYQYYQQIAQQCATQANCDINAILQNTKLQEQIQQQAVQYAQAACSQLVVSNKSSEKSEDNTIATSNIVGTVLPENKTAIPVNKTEQKISLVHYSSDSSGDDEDKEIIANDEKCTFMIPSTEIALIIDKMATYVSKNGPTFENSVREKGDSRFDFLNEDHKYHKYYKYKVNEFSSKTNGVLEKKESQEISVKNQDDDGDNVKAESKEEKIQGKKVIAPVSFSIKKSKEDTTKDIKSALPIEESDEEMITQTGDDTYAISTAFNCLLEPVKDDSKNGKKIEEDPNCLLEMIDLTEDADMKKLPSAIRERALQMDRKKRAALFLKMKSSSNRKERDRRQDKFRVPEDIAISAESELEEGEIKSSSKSKSASKKIRHKRSKRRDSYTESKSRHRKHKKRKSSVTSEVSTSVSSDTD